MSNWQRNATDIKSLSHIFDVVDTFIISVTAIYIRVTTFSLISEHLNVLSGHKKAMVGKHPLRTIGL